MSSSKLSDNSGKWTENNRTNEKGKKDNRKFEIELKVLKMQWFGYGLLTSAFIIIIIFGCLCA